MVDKLPKYRRGIGTGRTIAQKSGVPAGVMLPHHKYRQNGNSLVPSKLPE